MKRQCGDLLVIKMSDGNVMTQYLTPANHQTLEQDWGNLSERVADLMAEHHPDKTAVGFALADAEGLSERMKAAGVTLDDLEVAETVRVPSGATPLPSRDKPLARLQPTDRVVCMPRTMAVAREANGASTDATARIPTRGESDVTTEGKRQ